MTYELIRNFITIAKTGNITRSAEILFVSQSTVSHRLQLLEEQLGHNLVFRGKGKRQSTLTQWGDTFLPIAEKWLDLWQETEAFRQDEKESTLTVGCTDSLSVCLLRRFFSDFIQFHPSIHLRLTVLDTEAIYRRVNAGEMDLGIVLANFPHESVNIRPLLSEKMYCVCHPNMFPGKNRISTELLDPNSEILLNWSMEFSLWHDFRLPRGSKPRVEVNTILLVEDALALEGSWAIVPKTVAEHFQSHSSCRVLELDSPPPDRVSYVISRLLPDSHTRDMLSLFHQELDTFVANYQDS